MITLNVAMNQVFTAVGVTFYWLIFFSLYLEISKLNSGKRKKNAQYISDSFDTGTVTRNEIVRLRSLVGVNCDNKYDNGSSG